MSVYDSTIIFIYSCFVAAVLGLVMGSFLNCTGIRIAKGQSFVKGRSHCPKCGHTLAAKDLFPVLSYLLLGGKCRYCGEKIAIRYMLSELFTAIVFVTILLTFDFSLRTVELLILACLLVTASCSDLEDYLIPDSIIIAGILIRLVFVLISGDILSAGLHSLIGGISISVPLLVVVLITEKILKKEAMGGGDIKLLFMMGLYFTWSVNFVSFLISCLIGIVFGLLYRKKEQAFPFGPALSMGCFFGAVAGEKLIGWYLSLFGL